MIARLLLLKKLFFFALSLSILQGLFAQSLFWEAPKTLLESGARFPNAASGGNLIVVVWQEFIPAEIGKGEIYLSCLVSEDAKNWRRSDRFAGPFSYQEREAPIYSLAVDDEGRIFLAIAASGNETAILSSVDRGETFRRLATVSAFATTVAPSLYLKSGGGLLLFVTQETENFLAIHYAISRDGSAWSDLKPLVVDGDLPINFLPHHTSLGSREYVVFQALLPGETLGYQLYLKSSGDGGFTWGGAVDLGFQEFAEGEIWDKRMFSNQRPFITALNGKLGLTWERQFRSRSTQVYYAELDPAGRILGEPERVSGGIATARFPQIIRARDRVNILWFDNRRGDEHIFIGEKKGFRWIDKDLSNIPGVSSFARPVRLQENLYVFWENQSTDLSRLILLEPDQTVSRPSVRPVNFNPEIEARFDTIRVRWSVPRDSSGIAGFNYSWSQNKDEPVEKELRYLSDTTRTTLQADRDGEWHFRVQAMDYAGNWSEPAAISYTRDTLPPDKVVIKPPDTGLDGYLVSSTFDISWQPAAGEEPLGYSYSLHFLGSTEMPAVTPEFSDLPERVKTVEPSASFTNQDNGFWIFSVAALDRAGNIGKPEIVILKLNKYVPVTYVSTVTTRTDLLGNVNLRLAGRGFAEGGLIQQIVLDRDGNPPYDYAFARGEGFFRVVSDRVIDNFRIEDLEEGVYKVGVVHPRRGLNFAAPLLRLESQGTVKFGNFVAQYIAPWKTARRAGHLFTINDIAVWMVVLFLIMLGLVSVRKMASLVREGQILKVETIAVLHGQMATLRKEKRMEELKRRGFGLRLKFTLLTMILVLIIVLMVAFPMGNYMIKTQKDNLVEGLLQRVEVLLGSLASGAGTNLPIQNRIDLGLLPQQITAMEEARYATITGAGANDPDAFDYIWGTNDPDIYARVAEGEYRQGETRIKDEISPLAGILRQKINEQAQKELATLSKDLDKLSDEAGQYALKTDPESRRKLQDLQTTIREFDTRIKDALRSISSLRGSFPEFDSGELYPLYTFYRPIVYRKGGEDIYYRGLVRLAVSTERIVAEIKSSTITLIRQTGIIALIAAGLGLLGAIIMASITVNPIKKLAAGVAVIRDTDDKEKLKDHRIEIRSRDEIGTLADTVNQMTRALVKAAVANKDLVVGKEVQKMFIPLEKDATGRKGTTGGEENEHIEIYGYYEGAKGVSGDYFDYVKLADKYYAVIKCDVAGKGVPAALIMVEVSTIFSTFFRKWTLKSPGLRIDRLVYQMNDMLEERGFKGRFAALTLCIYNAETGKGYICNAGDANLHVYNRTQNRMIEIKLPEAPAAGVFPSEMVEMQAGFKQVAHQLNKGDALFLFTDGIEEAKRQFRNEEFEAISCTEPGLEDNEEHGGTHLKGSSNEEMGIPRIYEIINSVSNLRKYRLVKYHNPAGDEELTFDFTSCRGSVEESVLALVAVEKIFRIYPDPRATGEDRVTVDKKIDLFLEKHFEQYRTYFTHRQDTDDQADTVTFTHLKEDEQYDDLTILVLRKK